MYLLEFNNFRSASGWSLSARASKMLRMGGGGRFASRALALALLAGACTNDPYPGAERSQKIYYTSFREAPKTLDPAVGYNTVAHEIQGSVNETLLEYHYLERPYRLIPALAEAVPEPRVLDDGRISYTLRIRPGVVYKRDACFPDQTREVIAQDFAFELARIADPALVSPVIAIFSRLSGFAEFSARLVQRRAHDAEFSALPVHEQYARIGGIDGVRAHGEHELELVLDEPYPQLLYWLAMPFTAPVPWEAVAYYDGQDGRDHFADHPVGAGPYSLAIYEKRHRMVLEANPDWYGVQHPEWRAPGTVYPSTGEPGDAELLDPKYVGKPLPFIQRIEYRLEKEQIPRFGKFLQGYYDSSRVVTETGGGIVPESFDQVVQNGEITPAMAARGMRLRKSVTPGLYYIGFNMTDPTVGHAAGERGRKLRQALSLVIDSREFARLFMNGSGAPANSMLPPGIFGHDAAYRNPYRQVDAARARALLAEAGYPGGIDPATGRPLELGIDSRDPRTDALVKQKFFTDSWRTLGIDVEIRATTYNQFQDKVKKGAYQIFYWGWFADYPDPENFMAILESSNSRTKSGGENTANFSDPRFDALFAEIETRPSDARRLELLDEMVALIESERPVIELYYDEVYALYHPWLHNVKAFGMSFPMWKYADLDPAQRAQLRAAWNEPVTWPAYAFAGLFLAIVLPGVRTFLRERQ